MAPSRRELSRLGKAAVRYATRGWRVFPLKPRDKVPLTTHGFKDATCDPATVAAWWDATPDANIGFVPGASGLVVIDADGPVGRQSLQSAGLLSEPTLTATTGRPEGGFHLYYRLPEGASVTASDIGRGTTVRCHTGYVVVPPSIHPSGTRYTWDKSFRGIAELPPQALALLDRTEASPPKPATASLPDVILEGEGRNNALTSLGGTMRRRGMTEDSIRAALLAENQTRCVPPLDEREVEGIARSVGRYEPAARVTGTPRAAPVLPFKEASARSAVPMVVNMRDVEPEAVRWLWPGYIPMGKLTVLEGDPGLGKSTLALAIAAAVSRGFALPGGAPSDPAHVILISYEDALADTLRPRLDAAGAAVTRVHAITGMEVTEEVQNLIVRRATSGEIQKTAVAQEMVTMRQDGYLKALTGLTTLDEVNRVAANMA